MEDFLAIDKPSIACHCCWRVTSDGTPICNGSRVDIRDLVVSIPVVFIVEIEELMVWNLPPTLPVPTASPIAGSTYHLAALGIYSDKQKHFRCRYLSSDQSRVYTYDDMTNGGIPTLETGSPDTHFYGRNIKLDGDWKVTHAFYYLEGGCNAQTRFYEERTSSITKKYPLAFSSSDLNDLSTVSYTSETHTRMFPGKRNWKQQANRSRTAEYVYKDAPDPYSSKTNSTTPKEPLTRKGSVLSDKEEAEEFEDLSTKPSKDGNISASNTDFDINCRCGTKGDGNVGYNFVHTGEVVECDSCREWMHIACQRGRGDVPKAEKFECERCDISHQR